MATHSTGTGNLTHETNIIKSLNKEGLEISDSIARLIVEHPQHFAVLFRELSIIRHWLAFKHSNAEKGQLKQIFENLFYKYFPFGKTGSKTSSTFDHPHKPSSHWRDWQ